MDHDSADEFLVKRIRAGDKDAWRQLIDRYEGRLKAYARMRAASRSDAEDLVQETMIGFARSLNHYDVKRSLETYLFTILRYKICDQLRQRKITPLNPSRDDDDWWDQISDVEGVSPSRHAQISEEREAFGRSLAKILRRLIHELRDRQAFDDLQVVELIFYKGVRNLEVARLLEMDQKAVAGVKFRAIQRLHRYLEEDGGSAVRKLDEAEVTVAQVWRAHRLTCLKRSTLGTYLMGVLDDPWLGYTQFHLDVVGCPMCLANLKDLESDELEDASGRNEQIFQSSIGFLSRATGSGDSVN